MYDVLSIEQTNRNRLVLVSVSVLTYRYVYCCREDPACVNLFTLASPQVIFLEYVCVHTLGGSRLRTVP